MSLLTVLGEITVDVKHWLHKMQLSIVVVAGNGPNLLGRDWLLKLKLDWAKVNQVHQDSILTSLLAKFTNVFSEELGSLVGTPIKIHIDFSAVLLEHVFRAMHYLF